MRIDDEKLIAYLEGDLSVEEESQIEMQIRVSEDLRMRMDQFKSLNRTLEKSTDWEPPAEMFEEVEKAIEKEKRPFYRKWMAVAAAIIIWFLGYVSADLLQSGDSQELQALRSDLKQLQETVLAAQLGSHTASERIQAVNHIENSPTVETGLIDVLIKTLNTDESPNVRYAALQALEKFSDKENVRMELVRSLDIQTDPLIQIALINLLISVDEKSAIAPLRKLKENEATNPEVIKQADIAINVLI